MRITPAILATILFGASMPCIAATNRCAIVGHRGGKEFAPENTVAAFRTGFAAGADGCELDVQRTKDGHLIVIHDGTTKRTTGVDRKVSDSTFEELRALDAANWADWKAKGFTEKLPTLDEMLAQVPAGRKVYLHSYMSGDATALLREPVERAGLKPDQVVFLQFYLEPCIAFKRLFPASKAFWLISHSKEKPRDLADLIAKAKAGGIDGLSFDYNFPLDPAAVAQIRAAGLEVHVWTVNKSDDAKRMADLGVDSITTDRPEGLRKELGR